MKGADDKDRTAIAGADGAWFVEGLPAGGASATAALKGAALSPAEHRVTIDGAHVVDVDFAAPK